MLKGSGPIDRKKFWERKKKRKRKLPPVRFELTTPGLRDQCSTTELKRLVLSSAEATHNSVALAALDSSALRVRVAIDARAYRHGIS